MPRRDIAGVGESLKANEGEIHDALTEGFRTSVFGLVFHVKR